MSAYTPRMGGKVQDTANIGTPKSIDYVAQAPNIGLPAILRRTPVEHDAGANASALKIQIHASTGTGTSTPSLLQASVNAERAAYLQMIAPTFAEHTSFTNLSLAHVRDEDELIRQIPRLKETLAALDSEMGSGTTTDVEKRLLVHERIMHLQGAQLTRVQQAVEQTVHSMSSLVQAQTKNEALRAKITLHDKLHKASVATLVDTKKIVEGLAKTSALHSALHKASGEGVIGLRQDTGALQRINQLHSDLHKASGEGVIALRKQTSALEDTSALHSQLHHASGEGVLDLRAQTANLQKTSKLHTELHQASGAGVLGLHAQAAKLQHTSDLHTQLHMASGKCMATLQSRSDIAQEEDADDMGDEMDAETDVDAQVDAEDMRQMRADLDELAAQNKRLRDSVALHEEMHRTTSAIVSALHDKSTVQGMDCHDKTCTCGQCPSCLRNQKAKRPVASESGSDAHARILSMLQKDVVSSNKPRQNRGI